MSRFRRPLRIAWLIAAAAALSGAPAWSVEAPADVTALIESLGLVEAAEPLRETSGWREPRRVVIRAARPGQVAAFQTVAPGVEIIAAADEQQALAAAPTADALIGFCEPAIVEAATNVRWIQLYSAGAGPCVGQPAIRKRGILVTNMQRVSGPEIAEHVLAMLLAFTRGLYAHLPAQRAAEWNPERVPGSRLWELEGRTMLVVGLGGIGTEVARRANALGMRVIATRAGKAPRPTFVDYVGTPAELSTLAARADVVVNCTPLIPSTNKLFDARFFAAMKPGGYFLNVGRGSSVVQDDLVAALRSGQLAGAGLDVTDPEPLPADHPLWKLPNVIITPHVAASSDRVFNRVFMIARENLRRYVAGERMLSVVDPARGY